MCSLIDSKVAIASTAPAAPSRWPNVDFGAVTTTPSAALPKTSRIAFASATSPAGVDVACALMCVTSDGARSAFVERRTQRANDPATFGVGRGDVVAVGGDAGAGDLAENRCAAGHRVLGRFEHDARRRLRP